MSVFVRHQRGHDGHRGTGPGEALMSDLREEAMALMSDLREEATM
ncbi:hypothetical protein [Mycobacteroides abscessus]|nr:hypothetical protein [Mycobacteroides abscessus]